MKKIVLVLFIILSTISSAVGYNVDPEELAKEIHEINNVIFDYENIDKWDLLINGTVSAETLYGTYKGNGNLCLSQISKAGYGFVDSRLTEEDKEKLKALGYENIKFKDLKADNRLSIIYCCLYYKYKLAGVPPKNLEDCAKVWKKYYNTIEGKGRPKDFIVRFNKYGLKYVMSLYTGQINESYIPIVGKALKALAYNG